MGTQKYVKELFDEQYKRRVCDSSK